MYMVIKVKYNLSHENTSLHNYHNKALKGWDPQKIQICMYFIYYNDINNLQQENNLSGKLVVKMFCICAPLKQVPGN